MYAVFTTGGKQYRVAEGDVIFVEKLDVADEQTIEFDNVLVVGKEDGMVVGTPNVAGAKVVAKALKTGKGKKVTVVLGFNKACEIMLQDELQALGAEVLISTMDGSCGTKGFVTDAMGADYSYFYTCGPEPMLKAVYRASKTSGQMSFEERMGCGFGACMGCSCKTLTGNKRICKEGPVMKKEEILWED